jgi:hypothetical protein
MKVAAGNEVALSQRKAIPKSGGNEKARFNCSWVGNRSYQMGNRLPSPNVILRRE